MSVHGKTLSDRERAAIFYHVFGGVDDWKVLYLIARDEAPPKDPKDILYLSDLASKWKRSPKIQDFLADVLQEKARQAIAIEEKAKREEERVEGSERTESKPGRAVDYYDPANQRKQINRIIAESSDDPKTQLDAIKAIQQTQRDDRQAAKDSQIQRFYTPIQCRDCIIKANFAKLRRRMQAQEGQPEDGSTTI